MNIFEQLNKISATEKKQTNKKSCRKMYESVRKTRTLLENADLTPKAKDALEYALEYIRNSYDYDDFDTNIENNKYEVTLWGEDYEGNSIERNFALDIDKLVELVDDEAAFEEYIESCESNTEGLAQEYYERAEQDLEKHFGCTGAFLEPSTQAGVGGIFLFADDMSFDGYADYETAEEYIREQDYDGFLNYLISCITPEK